MHQSLRIITAVFLLVFASSSYASESGVATVDAVWIKAMKSGDVAAVVNCYDKNAISWLTGAPIAKGSVETRAAYKRFLAAYSVKGVSITEAGSETVGNKSVAWGTYRFTTALKAGGAPVTSTGRYTEIAKRVGGKWVYIVDHASDDPTSPPTK
ncbi:MAG: nuclear transport factor 2 family protein [Rhodanobacter sp.]